MSTMTKPSLSRVESMAETHSRAPSTLSVAVSKDGRSWWKEAIVFQIYPASFNASPGNKSGRGDLKAIRSKLGYLQNLGVTALWLTPVYQSPQVDMGYDISDYCKIHEPYGTMEDLKALLDDAHSRGMKLIMDLVVNHTSDLHAWFIESKSSLTNPKRDWYIWRKGKTDADGTRHPPNNWLNVFRGGSAWEYDPTTDEYYLHLFVIGQPDLNWENPQVREAVYDMMRWWLQIGIDGFRMDVINLISKVEGFPDATITEPGNLYQPSFEHTANGPKVHEYLRELSSQVLAHYNCLTVGETPYTHDPALILPYVDKRNKELQMCFVFDLVNVDGSRSHSGMKPVPWKLTTMKQVIAKWQHALYEQGWNSIYMENHDQARSVTRFGNDSEEFRAVSAKLLAMMQISQCGTIYIYQGQEIGQKNVEYTSIDDFKDVSARTYYQLFLERRRKETGEENPDMSEALANMRRKARDNGRTPCQWDDTPNAGFCDANVEPWMKIHSDYPKWNAAAQVADPTSVYHFWRRLFDLRSTNLTLIYGSFAVIDFDNESVFAYVRTLKEDRVIVVLNFSKEIIDFDVSEVVGCEAREWMIGNYEDEPEKEVGNILRLRPYEGRFYYL